MIDTAMVLAAGLGTRMRPLTDDRPKPLLPVAGRSLLDRALDRVAEGGIDRAVVNIHYRAMMVRAAMADRTAPDIILSDESGALLETGGGVRRALPLLGPRPFVVMNSDAVWGGPRPVPALLAAWNPARMDALLLLVRREDARGYSRAGDFRLSDGRLVRRGEAPDAPYVYTGAQIIAPGLFEGAPDGAFSLNLVWDRAIEAGRAFGIVHGGAWVDVGTPQGLLEAERVIEADR